LKSTTSRFRESNPDALLRKAMQRLSYDVDQGVLGCALLEQVQL
jgi:hypothetical protein